MKYYDATKIDLENLPILPFELHKSSKKGEKMKKELYDIYIQAKDHTRIFVRRTTVPYSYAVVTNVDRESRQGIRLIGLRSDFHQAENLYTKTRGDMLEMLCRFVELMPPLTTDTPMAVIAPQLNVLIDYWNQLNAIAIIPAESEKVNACII